MVGEPANSEIDLSEVYPRRRAPNLKRSKSVALQFRVICQYGIKLFLSDKHYSVSP